MREHPPVRFFSAAGPPRSAARSSIVRINEKQWNAPTSGRVVIVRINEKQWNAPTSGRVAIVRINEKTMECADHGCLAMGAGLAARGLSPQISSRRFQRTCTNV